jgi:hypothetical protein
MYGWTLDEIVGLKPRLLVPEIMSERELGEVRRGISDGSYLGKVVNRNKSGEIFAVELATFQITTPPATQPGLMLGVSTLHGHIAGVVNELVSELCWRLNRSEKDSPLTDRGMSKSRRIQELRKHGYTMKQIAQVMGVDANTPYVILSREKPVRRVVVTANKKSP